MELECEMEDVMRKPVVASYCTTFLKPEMLHIYRQVTSLSRFGCFVICKERLEEERYPFADIELKPVVRSQFLRRFWLKYVRREPPIVYRGEYGVLARILRRRQADLMHVYFGHTGVHLLPFIERWPLPVVVSFHGMDVQERVDQPGYVDRLGALLQAATLVLARSHSLLERLRELGCPEDKLRLNRTGIPLDRFPEQERGVPDDGAWHLVQACRLVEKKGIPVTLEAFARVWRDYPRMRLTIAGEGPMQGEIEGLIEKMGLSGVVEMTGFIDEEALGSLYRQAHIFIHPSQITADQNQEGVPNAMLEAMATGLPVLATLHGGIPEAVEHGESGLLSPECDVDTLEVHMRRLLGESGLWRRLGRRAASSVRENFEQRAQISRLEDCYEEAIRRHRGGRATMDSEEQ